MQIPVAMALLALAIQVTSATPKQEHIPGLPEEFDEILSVFVETNEGQDDGAAGSSPALPANATEIPTPAVTHAPTPAVTVGPTPAATNVPTPAATDAPTPAVTHAPTPAVTASPTPAATDVPTPAATDAPTPATAAPTPAATDAPTPAAPPPPGVCDPGSSARYSQRKGMRLCETESLGMAAGLDACEGDQANQAVIPVCPYTHKLKAGANNIQCAAARCTVDECCDPRAMCATSASSRKSLSFKKKYRLGEGRLDFTCDVVSSNLGEANEACSTTRQAANYDCPHLMRLRDNPDTIPCNGNPCQAPEDDDACCVVGCPNGYAAPVVETWQVSVSTVSVHFTTVACTCAGACCVTAHTSDRNVPYTTSFFAKTSGQVPDAIRAQVVEATREAYDYYLDARKNHSATISTNISTCLPTPVPTIAPTAIPTSQPTTPKPTLAPTRLPTMEPTRAPTATPTTVPSSVPTTWAPTRSPTPPPSTAVPTEAPTDSPTVKPTSLPTGTTVTPTESPTASPLPDATPGPTNDGSTAGAADGDGNADGAPGDGAGSDGDGDSDLAPLDTMRRSLGEEQASGDGDGAGTTSMDVTDVTAWATLSGHTDALSSFVAKEVLKAEVRKAVAQVLIDEGAPELGNASDIMVVLPRNVQEYDHFDSAATGGNADNPAYQGIFQGQPGGMAHMFDCSVSNVEATGMVYPMFVTHSSLCGDWLSFCVYIKVTSGTSPIVHAKSVIGQKTADAIQAFDHTDPVQIAACENAGKRGDPTIRQAISNFRFHVVADHFGYKTMADTAADLAVTGATVGYVPACDAQDTAACLHTYDETALCTCAPTAAPTTPAPTGAPTDSPTTAEPTTAAPTTVPPTTSAPTTPTPTTAQPTTQGPTTSAPTTPPPSTEAPTTPEPTTAVPTGAGTDSPSMPPTAAATDAPTGAPTLAATPVPSQDPTGAPTGSPTMQATSAPSSVPTASPSAVGVTATPTITPPSVAPTTPSPSTAAPTTLLVTGYGDGGDDSDAAMTSQMSAMMSIQRNEEIPLDR